MVSSQVMNTEEQPPRAVARRFQISEADLETLEQQLPEIVAAASSSDYWNNNKSLQEASEMVKSIVSNVRWNYGPPAEVHRIPSE
jgi:hypothetical protein